MDAIRKSVVVLAVAGAVSAQTSSVINVFFPDADQGQTLVGSLVASDSSKTTVAFGCAATDDPSDCGFGEAPVTVTFGPSTFQATETLDTLTLSLDCALTGTTAASCVQTYVGPIGNLETNLQSLTASDYSFDTSTTTSVTTTVLSESEMNYIPVTLTAFANAASTGTGASGSASTTRSTSGSTQTGASASATGNGTSTGGAASISGSGSILALVGAGVCSFGLLLVL